MSAQAIADAMTAYADLLKGQAIRELRDQNGESVSYTRADLPRLAAYIQQLQAEASTAPLGSRGPLRAVF